MRQLRYAAVVTALIASISAGCGSKATQTQAASTAPKIGIGRAAEKFKVSNDFEQLGTLYAAYVLEHNQPPKSLESWKDYLTGDARPIYDALAEGRYVLVWNASKDTPDGASNTALAWEGAPGGQGNRYVLMADGKVVKLVPEAEFQQMPKAKSK